MIKNVTYFKLNKNKVLEKIRKVDFHYGGELESDIYYVNGEPHGKYMTYYRDGSICRIGNFKNGKRDGKWLYHDDGRIIEYIIYDNDEMIDCKKEGENDKFTDCMGGSSSLVKKTKSD
tara:strand:- start:158 stop:511 length:354 start_codon:yes stop_codon:yes gene_type:complete